MMGGDARGGGAFALAMRPPQFIGLTLQLPRSGRGGRERLGMGAPFIRARCPRAGRKKRCQIAADS
jgi:hypothetical protein